MFPDNMVEKKWNFQKDNDVLRYPAGVLHSETGEINTWKPWKLFPEKQQMLLPRGDEYIVIHRLKLNGERHHAACMTQSPFERAYKYVVFLIQSNPKPGFVSQAFALSKQYGSVLPAVLF